MSKFTTVALVLSLLLLNACSERCPGFRAGFVDFPSASNGIVNARGDTLLMAYRRPSGEGRGTPYEASFVERGTNLVYTAPITFLSGEDYSIDISDVPAGTFAININVLDGIPTFFEVGAEGGVVSSACSGAQPYEPDVDVVRTVN